MERPCGRSNVKASHRCWSGQLKAAFPLPPATCHPREPQHILARQPCGWGQRKRQTVWQQAWQHSTVAAASPSSAPAGHLPAQDMDLRTVSLLLLVHESINRSLGRPLVECSDLLQLPAALTDLKCCALLVEPAGPGLTSSSGGASLSDSRSGSSSHARPASTGYRVTWMNAAAQQLLACGRERGRSSIALSSSTASSSRDAGPSPLSRHLPLEELIPSARELPLKAPGHVLPPGQAPAHAWLSRVHLQAPLPAPTSCSSSRSHQSGDSSSTRAASSSCSHDISSSGQSHSSGQDSSGPQASQQPPLWQPLVEPSTQSGGAQGSAAAVLDSCLVCDVASPSGAVLGAVLLFDCWTWRDERLGRPLVPAVAPDQVPGPADLSAAEERVRALADGVRSLKVAQGRSNTDPAVQAAVAELKAAKEAVGHLELLIAAYTAPVAISSRAQTPSLQQARQHGYGVLAALQQSQMLEQAAQQKPV